MTHMYLYDPSTVKGTEEQRSKLSEVTHQKTVDPGLKARGLLVRWVLDERNINICFDKPMFVVRNMSVHVSEYLRNIGD